MRQARAVPESVMSPGYDSYRARKDQQEQDQVVFDLATAALPFVGPAARGVAMGAKALAPKAAQMAEGYMSSQGMMPSVVEVFKGYPKSNVLEKTVNNIASEWRNNPQVLFANPSASTARVAGNMDMSISELADGNIMLKHMPQWGSKSREFHVIGDDLDEVIGAANKRLSTSNAGVASREKYLHDNSLLGKLQKEYGDAFKVKKSERSASQYITHEPSGTKIRISDHDLPLAYEQADINLRTGMPLQDQLDAVKKYFGGS